MCRGFRVFARAAVFATILLAPAAAPAQDYPNRAITIIAPFPPGASTDSIGRLMHDGMSEALGQPIIIENRGGAGGTTGTAYVANAKPDGYTIVLPASATLSMNKFMQKNFPFDPKTALAAISFVAESTLFLAVNPSLPVHNVAELIDYGRKNPGKLSYGSAGVGSGHHIAGELLKQKTGIDMVHVPYKGGGPAIQDLIAGNIPVSFGTAPAVLPQAQAGLIRVLASTRAQRDPDLPDIPTIAETVPGVVTISWFGLFAPAGTPQSIIDRLNQAAVATLRKPEVIARFKLLGLTAKSSPPAELDAFVKQEIDHWGQVIPTLGIEPE